MFGLNSLFSDPVQFVVTFLALVISISIHEFAHVLSAYLQGDTTGKALGRLTLNPLRHLDPIGTIAMILVGIGWGKPAPFNPYNLRYRRWGPAFVALAGPISNILMVMIAGYALILLHPILGSTNLLRVFLSTMVILNAALAVFNLIPVHPLDGAHLLRAILGPANILVQTLERYGVYLLLALLFLGGPLISAIILAGVRFILTVVGLGQLL